MTADASLPPTSCPSSLIASCAPLLGFQPDHCIVGFVLGVPGRRGPVLVRLDLGDGTDTHERAHSLAVGIAGTGGEAVDLVAWVAADDDATRADLPTEALFDELYDLLGEAFVHVTAALTTNGRVWWSHDCPDLLCCGRARPLDQRVLTGVQAEYVYAGYAPLASRADLAARIARDSDRGQVVARDIGRPRPKRDLERWREVQIGFLSGLLVPGFPSRAGAPSSGLRVRRTGVPLVPVDAARVLRVLGDVRVRDVVLHRMIVADQRPSAPWDATVQLLEDLVRCAPPGEGAPAATLLAIVAWLRGEGALANVALDRTEEDDPEYRLGELTRQVMTSGVDPAVWRRTMATLTEEECRGRRRRGVSRRRGR